MNGKGSKPRPLSVPQKQFDESWDAIFGAKKKAAKKKSLNKESVAG